MKNPNQSSQRFASTKCGHLKEKGRASTLCLSACVCISFVCICVWACYKMSTLNKLSHLRQDEDCLC